MRPRKYRHVGHAGPVFSARQAGEKVAVLCGRTIYPLDAEALDELPTCPTCATARGASFANGSAGWYITARNRNWVSVSALALGGGAA